MATWTISTLERNTSDNLIITAHWRATDVDGDYSASSYGTCSFTPDSDRSGVIPYAELNEAMVLEWCWESGVDKDAIEASLAANINEQKNPTTVVGVPW